VYTLVKEILMMMLSSKCRSTQRAACTRSPAKYAGAMVVGRYAVRIFEQFAWLEASSVKVALRRPT